MSELELYTETYEFKGVGKAFISKLSKEGQSNFMVDFLSFKSGATENQKGWGDLSKAKQCVVTMASPYVKGLDKNNLEECLVGRE